MYIWSFDLSISSTGASIFTIDGTPILQFSIRTKAKDSYGKRLKIIHDGINVWLEEYPCSILIVESAFTRFNKATQVLYRVHGLIEFMFNESKYFSYAPTTIKKTITGNGRATKEEVSEKILERYKNIKFGNDDESDSFATGVCFFIKQGMIEW